VRMGRSVSSDRICTAPRIGFFPTLQSLMNHRGEFSKESGVVKVSEVVK